MRCLGDGSASDLAKIELVCRLLDNGIEDYLDLAGEQASFAGFLAHVKETANANRHHHTDDQGEAVNRINDQSAEEVASFRGTGCSD